MTAGSAPPARSHRLWWWLALALLLHLPFAASTAFFADDYLQAFALAGDAGLQQQGFANQGQPGSLAYAINNQFNFFHPDNANHALLKQKGVLPWWLPDEAAIRFFRPLASLGRWLDYRLWPGNLQLMHAHSLLVLLLAWLALFFFYRRAYGAGSTSALAMLLLVLDVSILYPLQWLAARNTLLLLLSLALVLLALQRSEQRPAWLVAAVLAYLAGLLSAEGGVAIAAYVLAWLLLVSHGSWRSRLLRLLPFVLITLLWRLYYQCHGYGAQAVSQYLDPLAAPLAFAGHALLYWPVLALHALAGIEASDYVITGRWRYLHALAGVLVMLLPVLAARRLQVADRLWWFCYAGALLSLLPMTALTLSDPRLSVLAQPGLALALARILLAFWRQRPLRVLSLAGLVALASLVLHLLLPLLLRLALLLSPAADPDAVDARFNAFDGLDIAGRPVLIVNGVDALRLMMHPYRAAWHGLPQAASTRQLLQAETAVSIYRSGPRQFTLQQQGGLLLTAADVQRHFAGTGLHPARAGGAEAYSYLLSGFFHDGRPRFVIGQRWQFGELELRISALQQGRPQQLQLQLQQDNVLWLYWDWHSRRYRELALPAIGETIFIRGKYDDTQQGFQ